MDELIKLVDQYEAVGKSVREKIGIIYFPRELQVENVRLARLIEENNLTISVVSNYTESNPYKVNAALGQHNLYAIYTDEEFNKYFPELVKGEA